MSEGTYGRAPQQLGQLRTSDTTASACTETVHLRLLSLSLPSSVRSRRLLITDKAGRQVGCVSVCSSEARRPRRRRRKYVCIAALKTPRATGAGRVQSGCGTFAPQTSAPCTET